MNIKFVVEMLSIPSVIKFKESKMIEIEREFIVPIPVHVNFHWNKTIKIWYIFIYL